MTNKDLFKQAIAEAKTIREAAITNAKEALEESLTPHLKEMLAQKLQEMEEEEDKVDETVNNAEAEGFAENPNTHGNLEEAEEEEEEAEEEAPEGEEETGEEEEELEIEDMSVEDLKNLIRDIVAQETGHDESEEELPGEEAPEGEDMIGTDDSEEIDINELLAELEGMDEAHSYSLKPGAESGDTKGANDGYTTTSKRTPANSKSGNRYEPAKGSKPGRETFTNEGELNEMGPEYIEGARQLVEMFPFLTMSSASLIIGALGSLGLIGFSAITAKVMDMALAGKFGEKGKSFAEKLQAAGGAAAKATQNREGVEALNEEENIDENIDIIYQLIDAFPFLTNQTAELLVGVFGEWDLQAYQLLWLKYTKWLKMALLVKKENKSEIN